MAAQTFTGRLNENMNWFQRVFIQNHSNDATGAEGERAPEWEPQARSYFQHLDDNNASAQANQRRENARQAERAVVGAQPPLGPGNANLRNEVAADNPPQARGNNDPAQNIAVLQMDNAGPQDAPAAQGRGRGRGTGPRLSNQRGSNEGGTATGTGNVADHVNEGRRNLNVFTNALAAMAENIHDPPRPRRSTLMENVEALGTISNNLIDFSTRLNQAETAGDERTAVLLRPIVAAYNQELSIFRSQQNNRD